MILKKYKLLLLFYCCFFANSSVFAQEKSIPPIEQTTIDIAQAKQLNALFREVDELLKYKKTTAATTKLLQIERILKNLNADREPTWSAQLALSFAKIGLNEKARSYQAKAILVARSSTPIFTVGIVNNLAESYALLNDTKGLKAMFEHVLSKTPKANKRPIQIAYVNSLFGIDENLKASDVLTELYSDRPLSAAEQAEILSLLIINSIKLNHTEVIDQYYSALRALKTPASANYNLANGMYLTFKRRYLEATPYYHKLLLGLNAGKKQYVYLEGVLQLANLKSISFQKDSAQFYFSKVASLLKRPLESTAVGIHYFKFYSAHQARFKLPNRAVANQVLLSKDSVYQKELIALTKDLTYKYKIEQDKQKAAILKKQNELEAALYAKKKQRFLWILSSLGLLLISGGIIIYLLYHRKKQSHLLHQAELERLKQLHKTDVIKKLSAAQEAERWRIADQLHDEVGSMIAVVRLNLSDHPLKNEPISTEKLEAANRILANVADTVREMSHQLMPVAIRQYGLVNAIEQLINDINTSGKIYIEHLIYGFDNPGKYPEDFQISFYRIVQELFQNIVKHAKATNAIFQLIEHPDSINLYIEDNGKGIDNKVDNAGKGIGLLTNRIDYFEGKISIEGSPGKGTLIIIDIPTAHMLAVGD